MEETVGEKEDEQLAGVNDDVIEEEDEEDEEEDAGTRRELTNETEESENLLRSPVVKARRPLKPRPTILARLSNRFALGKKAGFGAGLEDEADILDVAGKRSRSRSTQRGGRASLADSDASSPNRNRIRPKGGRRQSDFDTNTDDGTQDRRTSVSSNSSGFNTWSKNKIVNLGLEAMDPSSVPEWAVRRPIGQGEDTLPVYIWGRASDENSMYMRVGFKRQISAIWLESYALKNYVDLNLTAFEKILKKWVYFLAEKFIADWL